MSSNDTIINVFCSAHYVMADVLCTLLWHVSAINILTRQRLVSSLILSRIDYGNVIFAGLPGVTLAPLRRVMNAAVRFVAGLGPRDHVTAAWRDLHWLPIDQRIIYKLCILMHAVRNGTAPTYIRDLVTPVNEISGRSHLRRLHLDISTYRELGQSSDQGPFRLRVLLHGTAFQRAFAS